MIPPVILHLYLVEFSNLILQQPTMFSLRRESSRKRERDIRIHRKRDKVTRRERDTPPHIERERETQRVNK